MAGLNELGRASLIKTADQANKVGMTGAYRNHNYYGYSKHAALHAPENLARYRWPDLSFLRFLFRQFPLS